MWRDQRAQRGWPYSFAWTTLREAGARLVFGSDWPVVSQNPMLGVHNALNRISWKDGVPHHRQSLTEALLSYTRDAAKLLNASIRTINEWIKQGEFPHAYKLNPTKQNSPHRIPHSDLKAFLEKRQSKSAQSLPLN